MDLGENWKLDETNWLSHGGIHPFASVKGGRTWLLVFKPPSECAGSLPDVLLPFTVLAVVPGVLLGCVQSKAVLSMKVGKV